MWEGRWLLTRWHSWENARAAQVVAERRKTHSPNVKISYHQMDETPANGNAPGSFKLTVTSPIAAVVKASISQLFCAFDFTHNHLQVGLALSNSRIYGPHGYGANVLSRCRCLLTHLCPRNPGTTPNQHTRTSNTVHNHNIDAMHAWKCALIGSIAWLLMGAACV